MAKLLKAGGSLPRSRITTVIFKNVRTNNLRPTLVNILFPPMTGDNVIIMPGITNKYVTLGLGEVDQ